MKLSYTFIVLMSAVFCGCQSGLYKISTSEDDKKIDESMRYYEIGLGADFIKDDGASPDGILYNQEQMPIKIIDGRSDMKPNEPGWADSLWMFSLGVFPMFRSEYVTQDITVKTPIGEKSGSYRVDAKLWIGWIPLFVGYPALAYERDDCAQLPNSRLEGVGKNRLVKNLAGSFSYKDYVAFAKSKNDERKAEIVRIKSVSEEVSKFLAKNKFDDAETLIFNESKSRSATQKCDEKSWVDMRERVVVARQAYEKNQVQKLIDAGRYEDAISFCNSKNSLSDEVNSELKNDAFKAAVKRLEDAKRLIAFLELIEDSNLIDDIVKKLANMDSLSLLTKSQLIKIANYSERDDIILEVINMVNEKSVLISFLDKQLNSEVLKALLEKIADADAVRTKILDGGKEDALRIYVSVFGSDDECLKLIKEYPDLLTDAVLNELKHKVAKKETKSVIDELLTKRLVAEISTLEMNAAIARVRVVDDEAIRSILLGKIAEKSITQHSLSKWNEHEISELKTAASIAAEVNNEDVTVAIVAKLLETIENYETRCRDSWSMRWGSEDETQVKEIVDCFAARMSVAVKEKILLKNKEGWKRIVSDICPESALKLLKMQQLKYVDLEVELAKIASPEKITLEHFSAVKSETAKLILKRRMSQEMRDVLLKKEKEEVANLITKSKKYSEDTFSLYGFYLGMPIEDAKVLVEFYLPNSKVVITKENNIEIDVEKKEGLSKYIDAAPPMYFCRADAHGKVYLFNFDKRFLRKWFSYDVQNHEEWVTAFAREYNYDFRSKPLHDINRVRLSSIEVTQEHYVYRNNKKGYVVAYYGEKSVSKDFYTPNNLDVEDSMYYYGLHYGLEDWAGNRWENNKGAKEGTLRVRNLTEGE